MIEYNKVTNTITLTSSIAPMSEMVEHDPALFELFVGGLHKNVVYDFLKVRGYIVKNITKRPLLKQYTAGELCHNALDIELGDSNDLLMFKLLYGYDTRMIYSEIARAQHTNAHHSKID